MQYIQLKAGDIRQDGDESKHNGPIEKGCEQDWKSTTWKPTKLIGQTILASDLVACSFRRPITAD